MSLPFDISEKLKSVQVRHYVEWLGRDSHCGYGFAFGYDEKSYRLIDELFQMLQDVETDDEDGAKELWLCARRGTIDDFAKQYGTYEENLEDGTVKNQKEYEDYWKSEFPDEVEWYRFVAVEHTDIKYRCVFLSNKQVLEMDKRLESGYTHDISEFTEWLVDAVKLTIEAVRNGTYNESVARLLPYKHRTGVITRAGLWKLYPEEKESFFEALTQEDVDEFLATGTEDCTGLPELKEMTAKVTNGDTVYILGDLLFRNEKPAEEYLKQLKGKKHLIIGNHDRDWVKKCNLKDFFESVNNLHFISDGKRQMTLCHYPMMSWPHMTRCYMVFGHIHGNTDADYWPLIRENDLMLNAGADVNGFAPVTFEEMQENNYRHKAGWNPELCTMEADQ